MSCSRSFLDPVFKVIRCAKPEGGICLLEDLPDTASLFYTDGGDGEADFREIYTVSVSNNRPRRTPYMKVWTAL